MSRKVTRLHRGLEHNQPGLAILAGKITLDGSGDQSALDFPGVASVTHDDTGDYTINLDDEYAALRGFVATVEKATAQTLITQVTDDDVQNGTISITFTGDDGAAEDPTTCAIHAIIYLDTLLGS